MKIEELDQALTPEPTLKSELAAPLASISKLLALKSASGSRSRNRTNTVAALGFFAPNLLGFPALLFPVVFSFSMVSEARFRGYCFWTERNRACVV
jgi:hypothetical protein